MSDGSTRDDHAELLRRRGALTDYAARPNAVERRHASNGRRGLIAVTLAAATARAENRPPLTYVQI